MSSIETKPENPPAFPRLERDEQWSEQDARRNVYYTVGGMSLRDWFAGQAMQGFVAALKAQDVEPYNANEIARYSFALADALLKERSKP